MTNWKTTTSAIFTALFAFVVFSPDTFAGAPWLVSFAKFAAAGGLIAFGVCSKDAANKQ
jgi:hypothetical protein